MAANKAAERFAGLTFLAPVGVNIASGAACVAGEGTHTIAMVAQEAQNTTNPNYDPNSGYLSFDLEGVYNLSVEALVNPSVGTGSPINTFDALFYSGGVYDKTSGITTGGTLSRDTTGVFFGVALAPLAAGTTATIPVLLKNCIS